jgi:hypothetical protein
LTRSTRPQSAPSPARLCHVATLPP